MELFGDVWLLVQQFNNYKYMYTAIIKGKSLSREGKTVTITVEFNDGTSTFLEDLKFGTDFTEEKLKRRIKVIITELEAVKINVDALVVAPVDLTGITIEEPITVEVDTQNKWLKQLNKLRTWTELKNLGAMPDAWLVDYNDLVTKVKTDAKKTYLT